MVAVVTGASSGIGRNIAKELARRNVDLILVARNKDALCSLAKTLNVKTKIIDLDLSVRQNCYELYEMLKGQKIDILVNNAGFGSCCCFEKSELMTDLNMIDLNICATQILTRLFVRDFIDRNHGYVMNVGSFAGFMAGGPLMATYYATKSYVMRLSLAIYEELRRKNSRVSISLLCPGPVRTNFQSRAGVQFSAGHVSSGCVAKDAVRGMFERRLLIIPGCLMKFSYVLFKFLPIKLQLIAAYYAQHRKEIGHIF